jgi:hypothetical protein
VITAAELRLAGQLRADGATTAEVVQVIELARQADRWGGRAIELASASYAASWSKELRGPHGEWIKSGADVHASVHTGQDPMAAAQHENEIRDIARQTAIKVATMQDVAFGKRAREQQAERDRKQDAQIQALTRQVRTANQHIAEMQSKTEGRKARTKSLAVISSLVGGAVLGGVEAKLGVPNLAAVVSSITPATIESLFEWKKRL